MSIIIPAYKLSASIVSNFIVSVAYSIISVTNSAVEEAYASWKVNIAFSIKSSDFLWWSIITILSVNSNNSGTST